MPSEKTTLNAFKKWISLQIRIRDLTYTTAITNNSLLHQAA
jgi:hypothetical protein